MLKLKSIHILPQKSIHPISVTSFCHKRTGIRWNSDSATEKPVSDTAPTTASSETTTPSTEQPVESKPKRTRRKKIILEDITEKPATTELESSAPKQRHTRTYIRDPRTHVVLVDGSGIFQKNFYALRKLFNGGLFGFTRQLMRVHNDLTPINHIAVFADPFPLHSWRHKIFPDYKKNQLKELPQDFKDQKAVLGEASKALSLNFIQQKDVESHDMIASYAKHAETLGYRVLQITIASPQKVYLQLVNQNIQVFDFDDRHSQDELDVRENYGVQPQELPLLHALIGDTIDGIPGIPHLSLTQAAELVTKYHTLSELRKNVDDDIKDYEFIVKRNLKVLQLKTDMPLPKSLEALEYKPVDKNTAYPFLSKYAFKSIIEKWNKDHADPADHMPELF